MPDGTVIVITSEVGNVGVCRRDWDEAEAVIRAYFDREEAQARSDQAADPRSGVSTYEDPRIHLDPTEGTWELRARCCEEPTEGHSAWQRGELETWELPS